MGKKKRAEPSWYLFVDESGNFDDPNASVWVAGVLVRTTNISRLQEGLRRELERIIDPFPWPLHARDLHSIAFCAIWSEYQGHRGSLGAACERIVAKLDAYCPDAVAATRARLASHRSPSFAREREMRKWLSEHDPDVRFIKDHLAEIPVRLPLVIDQMASSTRSEVLGVVVGEDLVGQSHIPGRDRYGVLLSALLERVSDVLAVRGEHGAAVAVHLGNRRVFQPLLGVSANMSRAVVDQWIKGLDPPCKHVARFSVAEIVTNNDRAPALFCVADFLANRSRRVGRSGKSLRQIEGRLVSLTSLVMRTEKRAPHLGACIDSSDHLREVRDGRARRSLTGSAKWAREQAMQWAALLGDEEVFS